MLCVIIVAKTCAFNNSYIFIIFCTHVYQVNMMWHNARMVAFPCWHFELSPLNELYRGKLVGSIMLIPFEIF